MNKNNLQENVKEGLNKSLRAFSLKCKRKGYVLKLLKEITIKFVFSLIISILLGSRLQTLLLLNDHLLMGLIAAIFILIFLTLEKKDIKKIVIEIFNKITK